MRDTIVRLLPLTPVLLVVLAVFAWKGDCKAQQEQAACCDARGVPPIWGTSHSDLWMPNPYCACAEHWNGTQWETEDLTPSWLAYSQEEETELEDITVADQIWGTGPDDVWAIDDHGGVWHRHDGFFEENDPPIGEYFALGGSAPDDVWAVGRDGRSAHWEGARWNIPPSIGPEVLTSVWSGSPVDAWMLSNTGEAFHWDGSVWSRVELPRKVPESEIRGFGPDDLWIFGPGGFVLHGDGTTWLELPVPPHRSWNAPRVSEVVRLGSALWVLTATGLARWDGTAWHAVQPPDLRSAQEKAEDQCPEPSCPPQLLARVGPELLLWLGNAHHGGLVVGDGVTWRPLEKE